MFFLSQTHGFCEKLRQMLRTIAARGAPILVGAVLLTAAALKTHQLATSPTTEDSLFTSRWFLIALVEFELALGLWLLSGAYPKQARVAALAAFAGFCLVSLFQALTGAASCGCFGNVPIHPWYTSLFDLAAVTMLWQWRISGLCEHLLMDGWMDYGTSVHILSVSQGSEVFSYWRAFRRRWP